MKNYFTHFIYGPKNNFFLALILSTFISGIRPEGKKNKTKIVALAKTNFPDYFQDEKGQIYTIGLWGERRYTNGAQYTKDSSQYRIDANNILSFGWKLFKNVESENFILSPLSPQILLSCLTKETNSSSASHKELLENVHYENSESLENVVNEMLREGTKRELKIASAFFMKKDPP